MRFVSLLELQNDERWSHKFTVKWPNSTTDSGASLWPKMESKDADAAPTQPLSLQRVKYAQFFFITKQLVFFALPKIVCLMHLLINNINPLLIHLHPFSTLLAFTVFNLSSALLVLKFQVLKLKIFR